MRRTPARAVFRYRSPRVVGHTPAGAAIRKSSVPFLCCEFAASMVQRHKSRIMGRKPKWAIVDASAPTRSCQHRNPSRANATKASLLSSAHAVLFMDKRLRDARNSATSSSVYSAINAHKGSTRKVINLEALSTNSATCARAYLRIRRPQRDTTQPRTLLADH